MQCAGQHGGRPIKTTAARPAVSAPSRAWCAGSIGAWAAARPAALPWPGDRRGEWQPTPAGDRGLSRHETRCRCPAAVAGARHACGCPGCGQIRHRAVFRACRAQSAPGHARWRRCPRWTRAGARPLGCRQRPAPPGCWWRSTGPGLARRCSIRCESGAVVATASGQRSAAAPAQWRR